jgi:hypothetical protein
MALSLNLFCKIIALVLFAIAAIGIVTGRFNLIAGGLFFWLASETFG